MKIKNNKKQLKPPPSKHLLSNWHGILATRNPTSATLPIALPTLCRSAVARMRQLPRRTVGASSSRAAAAPGRLGWWGWLEESEGLLGG